LPSHAEQDAPCLLFGWIRRGNNYTGKIQDVHASLHACMTLMESWMDAAMAFTALQASLSHYRPCLDLLSPLVADC
jgi:hypothetical protein